MFEKDRFEKNIGQNVKKKEEEVEKELANNLRSIACGSQYNTEEPQIRM